MRKTCRVMLRDQVFSARRGDILLDAALANGVDIPHDCRSGHCRSCRVRVLDGVAIGGECGELGAVRACQTRIMSDLRLEIEGLPKIQTAVGEVRTGYYRGRRRALAAGHLSAWTISARAVSRLSSALL